MSPRQKTVVDPPVHPAADVFPMLSEDELADLAEDIRANGLHHPITLDSDGVLIDGRNRLAACRLAGVEPTFDALNGHDPVAFILSENIRRRHLSAGQRAMAIALMLDLDGGRYNGARALTLESKVSEARVSQAVLIRRKASDLVDGIMAGTDSFDKAYEAAKSRKQREDDERTVSERVAREQARELEQLRRSAPDLAELVPDTLSIPEAKAALAQREQRDREAKSATTQLASSTLAFLDPGAMTAEEQAERIVRTLDATLLPSRPDLSAERFKRAQATLAAIVGLIEGRKHRGR